MEKYDIYKDVSERTGGDIFIGVVGPVRTGKSTFISKFMEKIVLPNINNKLQKNIAVDEMPQSALGKTIMTTQPKFVPADAVRVSFKNKVSANVRLIDCVGYFVDGAVGHEEGDKPRMIKTPWSDKEMPFEKAAEIGTKKVIDEYSTIAVLVTTDGSIGEIPRENYVKAEEKVVSDLKKAKKPFVIVLNSKNPTSSECMELADQLEKKYGVSVLCINALLLESDDISVIMEKILLEFPMFSFNVNLPKWMQSLSSDNPLIEDIMERIKKGSKGISKMRDFNCLVSSFDECENFSELEVKEICLGKGVSEFYLVPKPNLYYKVLSDSCGEIISDDYQLMTFINSFAKEKRKYSKIKDALESAENDGYGVVLPTLEEMNLEEPELVKQGGKFGVKLKASAPSLHIMKVDVKTEVAPIVGTEKQGEDLINFIMSKFEDNPAGIWETNMFGKSLHDLVNEGLAGKLTALPKDAQGKMRKTLTRMVNENKGGMICILL